MSRSICRIEFTKPPENEENHDRNVLCRVVDCRVCRYRALITVRVLLSINFRGTERSTCDADARAYNNVERAILIIRAGI